MSYLSSDKTGVILYVRVLPNAKKNAITGIWNDSHLKIAIHAPALDGKANEALISFIAKSLNLRKNNITLLSGQTCREKKLRIETLSIEEIQQQLEMLL